MRVALTRGTTPTLVDQRLLTRAGDVPAVVDLHQLVDAVRPLGIQVQGGKSFDMSNVVEQFINKARQ